MIIIAVSLHGNIQHLLAKHPLLVLVELYQILLLKQFFKKIDLSSPLAVITFSSDLD